MTSLSLMDLRDPPPQFLHIILEKKDFDDLVCADRDN